MARLIYSLLFTLSLSSLAQAMEKPEARSENGKTIVYAAYKNDIKLFNQLFNESTDVNQRDKGGRTALHYVVLNGNREIFQRLITHSDLDINVQDKDGVTPIRLAVCECIVPAVLALLQMGADPNIKDSHGISAVDEAKQAGYDGMLFFFELFKKEE